MLRHQIIEFFLVCIVLSRYNSVVLLGEAGTPSKCVWMTLKIPQNKTFPHWPWIIWIKLTISAFGHGPSCWNAITPLRIQANTAQGSKPLAKQESQPVVPQTLLRLPTSAPASTVSGKRWGSGRTSNSPSSVSCNLHRVRRRCSCEERRMVG